jgi:hypothetical protein
LNTYSGYGRERGSLGFILALIIGFSIVIGGFIGVVWWAGGTWSKTEAVEMTCVYNGGPFDNKNFKGYVEPGGGRKYQGFMSSTVDVPVRQVQYRVSLTEGQGDTRVPTSLDTRVKGYLLRWEPTVNFTFNTQIRKGKPVTCDLIEQHLRGFGATDFNDGNGNWRYRFLEERYLPVLRNVVADVMQADYDPGALKYNTDGARDKAAAAIGKELKTALVASLGDDFFCDTNYRFGQGNAECGDSFTVTLPEPKMDAEDEAQLAKPQRAKVDADNEIAAANEAARKATETAAAKEKEAESAARRATAEETIASENNRVQEAAAVNTYAWCEYLVQLNQDCALVKAAENGDFPTVFGTDAGVVVPLPAESAPAPETTVPAG